MWNIDKSALIPCIELALTDDLKAALSLLDNIGPELREQERKAIKRRLKTFDKVKRTRKYTLDNILKKLINDAGINTAVAKCSWREPELAIAKFDALLSFACSIDDSVDVAHKSLLQLNNDIETTFQSSGIELTTLHKSKGLAWPFVIMPYLEEGIIPSFEAISDPYQIEVERRLFYVGITRAREKLAFHIPRDNLLKRSLIKFTGTMNEVDYFAANRASRFVYETNFLSATTIAVDLRLQHLNTSISNTGNRILYNKYLHALGKSYRVSGLASED
jgi:superfamily I DNA/RNA helicase